MMLQVMGKDSEHNVQLTFLHGFYEVLLVVAEEEETSTLSSTFTRLENLLTIIHWTQTLLKYLHIEVVVLKELAKFIEFVVSDLDKCIDFLVFFLRLLYIFLANANCIRVEKFFARFLLPRLDIVNLE